MGFSRQEYWSGVPSPSPIVFTKKQTNKKIAPLSQAPFSPRDSLIPVNLMKVINPRNSTPEDIWERTRKRGEEETPSVGLHRPGK